MNKTSAAIVRTLLLGTSCLSVFAALPARAQPSGGTVTLGSATITSNGSSSTTINQSSGNLVINWNSFNIAAGGTVQFNQPGTSSIALNRILGADPTSIYGNLLANGQVWIINGNGVLFGKGSRINVGGLIATTSDLSDSDFAAGNYNFTGGTGASVINQGTIKTRKGGNVVLSGASAQNQGLIEADTGTVTIGGASAFTVDFQGDGLLRYTVSAPTGRATNGQTGASNSGTIIAPGGRVVMTARAAADVQDAVVNNTGMISATSAKVQNGEVILDGGDGDVNVAGTIDASGTQSGTTGGSVTVTGRNITVADGAKIDVSGYDGGGTVKIGGDLHGAGPTPNAANVTVGNASIKADATHEGNGGTVIVWSNGTTNFAGVVSAKGGKDGGNGGFVETSGHSLHVADTARVDTSAPRGLTGNWLLDPDYIDIEDDGDTTLTGGTLPAGQDPGADDTIAPSTITAALATTDVTLEANFDITVYDPVTYASTHALNLLAGGNVYVAADVQNAGTGAINVIAGWDGTTVNSSLFTTPGVYGNNSGSVFVTSDYDLDPGDSTEPTDEPDEVHPVAIGSAGGPTTIAGYDVSVLGYYAESQIGYRGAGGGDITVRASDSIAMDGSWGFNAIIGNGAFDGSVSGDVTGNIDLRTDGTMNLEGGEGGGTVWIGNKAAAGSTETGNLTLIAANGASDVDLSGVLSADLAGGDVTIGFTDADLQIGNVRYNSAHNLTLLSSDDLEISNTVSNDGTGAITLVAGWDGQTLDPTALSQPGAFGNNEGTVAIGTEDADGDVFVGSKGGALTVLTDYLNVDAENGFAQLGYHGAGGGNISVTALDDVDIFGGDPNQSGPYAMIGNGAIDGSVTGPVTGDIFLSAGGVVTLETPQYDGCGDDCTDSVPGGPHTGTQDVGGDSGGGNPTIFIGNASTGAVSGNVVVLASDIQDGNDSNGGFGRVLSADLQTGDVTVGEVDPENTALFHNDFLYSSSHNLTLLAAGDVDIEAGIENSGSGSITLVAGWDGIYDPTRIGADGTYGFNNGTVFIGGSGDSPHNSGVGAAQGDVKVYAANLTVDGSQGIAQLGYHGAGGGNIFVNVTGDISVFGGSDATDNAQIGNGSLNNDVTGNITGNITLNAGGQMIFFDGSNDEDAPAGRGWLGNVAGDGFTETGDVTALTVGGFFEADFITADLGTGPGNGGNVFLGFTDPTIGLVTIGGLTYSSGNSFTFASAGDMDVTGMVQNAGAGAVTLVAGWDGHTTGTAADIQTAGAFGQNSAQVTFGGEFQFDNATVGSAGGTTTVLTDQLTLAPGSGFYAQLGYHGTGGGDISVVTLGDLTLTGGSDAGEYAMIGNGSLNGDVSGNITGNISVNVGGTTSLQNGESDEGPAGQAWIGNVAASGSTETGNLTLVTFDLGNGDGLNQMLAGDVTGGDVTFAITDAESANTVADPIVYDSIHALSILTAGSLTVASQIQNSGSGNINVLAGWDGTTLDPTHFTDAGVYGNNGGVLEIGGGKALGGASLGSASGTTTALGYDLIVDADQGIAQLGSTGNASGNIVAMATHDVTVTATGQDTYALIGNGYVNPATNAVSGSITVTAGDSVFVTAAAHDTNAKIGNGELDGTGSASGDISVTAEGGNVEVSTTADMTFAQIGNGDKTQADVSGTIHVTGNTVSLTTGGSDSSAQIGHSGGARMNGAITIDAADVSLLSGADMSATQIGNGGSGLATGAVPGSIAFGGDITINASHSLTMATANNADGVWIGNGGDTTASGLTVTGSVAYSGAIDITVGTAAQAGALSMVQSGAGNSTMFIGNGGYHAALGTTATGGITEGGAITIDVLGGESHGGVMTLSDTGEAPGFVHIGNGGGAASGAVASGDIDLDVDGDLQFIQTGQNLAFAGNVAMAPSAASGDLTIMAQSVSGVETTLNAALPGGDVLIEILGSTPFALTGPVAYDSAHTLTVLAKGDVEFDASLQNAGTGAIDVVAGWNGTTTDAAHFGDAGVYGNAEGSIRLGGANASGDVAVGSAGGATNLYADDVTLTGTNGSVQLGYDGTATGQVNVLALGTIALQGGEDLTGSVEIGSGAVFGANDGAGDVNLTAAGVTATGIQSVVADNLAITTAGGDIAASNAPLQIAVNALILHTGGGNAFLTSPRSVAIASANLSGGGLTLGAGGPITQTGAIASGALDVSTTSGAITLTNSGNAFGALTVATAGSDNATLSQSGQITVASATVGGTLALTSGAGIGQTGAIHAGGVSATANGGTIVLTNTGNAFLDLTLSTATGDDATVTDGSAVALGTSTVGGALTLSAGGTVSQTGAVSAATLHVSTTGGDIALGNPANAVAGTVILSASGAASFDDVDAISLGASSAGGQLTLVSAAGIAQTGAIQAGGVSATANGGDVVLTNTGNAFATLGLSATGLASVSDTTAVTVTGTTITGGLTLSDTAGIGQSGAIHAGGVNLTGSNGTVVLTNAGNSFATLTLSTAAGDNATVTDSTAVTLGTSTVGGMLTLNAGGAVGQSGVLTSTGLDVTTTAGAIALTNTGNAVSGTVQLSTPGAATFYDTLATTIGATATGGDLTIASKGGVTFTGSVQDKTGNINVVAGWDGTTTDATHFGDSGVYGNNGGGIVIGGSGAEGDVAVGSQSGATSLYGASLGIAGTHGGAQLGYHGTGGGAILVRALHDLDLTAGTGNAMLGNGGQGTDVSGNVTGDIDVRIGGNLVFTDGDETQAWLGNATHGGSESGNLILILNDSDSTGGDRLGQVVTSALDGGDVTLGFTGTTDQGPSNSYSVNSSHTLNLMTAGNLVIAGSIQNAGTGAINLVAGWDGHTIAPSSFGTEGVAGNGGKGVTIGGADASGNVAIGSAGGTTTVYGASLTLTATHGYAQLGFNGHGTGAVVVDTSGAVTLTGGASDGFFVQIGNGGLKTSGDNGGDISITAGGDVVLTGGAGHEAYAQIGLGGAESNTGSNGYTNMGAITVDAANVTLTAGAGPAAYVEIGNGGYESGLNLAGGQAVNGGDITVTAATAVTLTGAGTDAFAQIGNGGSQSNLDAAASAGGADSGIVTVSAPSGPTGSLTLIAGAGDHAYAQIGNGGYAVNSGPAATAANFTVTGDITVTDLALTGGGLDGFAAIGNGDASQNSFGNISGDIVISANGNITYTNGTGTNSTATIGNFTGEGTVSGTLTGANPPTSGGGVGSDPSTIGVIVTNTATTNPSGTNPIVTINTVVVTAPETNGGATTLTVQIQNNAPPGPLALLDDKGADSSTPNTSDNATVVIADSLNGAKKAGATQTILAGMLSQTNPAAPGHTAHAIPPADQDFSSWGNEALWQ